VNEGGELVAKVAKPSEKGVKC